MSFFAFTRMSPFRIVLAFVLAPLMTPLTVMVMDMVAQSKAVAFGDVPFYLLVCGSFAYAATLILGVPAFFLFRRLQLNSVLFFCIGGGLIGLVVSLFVGESYSLSRIWNSFPERLWFLVAGALSATVFRLITGARNRQTLGTQSQKSI